MVLKRIPLCHAEESTQKESDNTHVHGACDPKMVMWGGTLALSVVS